MTAIGKMVPFFQFSTTLSKKDFTFFHSLFYQEIEHLLPVSGDVYFWEKDGHWLPNEKAEEVLGQGVERLVVLSASLEPEIIDNVLVLPVAVADGDNIAVIVAGIDPGLLQRMAPEWLHELCDNIQRALVRVKKTYVFPETGLYSSRLLELIWAGADNTGGAFFLLGAVEKTKRSTDGIVKIVQTAHLIEATINSPVIYFGGNVFGVYQENMSRENALNFARRLLDRLKREGLQRVHIGISSVNIQDKETFSQVLGECWQSLEIAERRGPYSLCEASYLYDQKSHPLAHPSPETVRKLQGAWRGLSSFSLLLIRVEKGVKKNKRNEGFLTQVINEIFQDKYSSFLVNSQECFVLLPDVLSKKAKQLANKIKKSIDEEIKPLQVAVGIGYWPCLDFSKTATISNCRKALMHGDFFGSGSVTLFDHVSLNVSGDYFFDEGDYHQAVRDYRAGLKIGPGEINLLNSLGVALTELNKLAEAEQYFDLVLVKEPKNFMALVNKGFALRMLRRDEEALTCFSLAQCCKEFSSSPVFADVSMQLGHLFRESGQHKEAVRVLEKMKARKLEKTGYLFFSLLGEEYAATGKNKKAISMLQKAIQLNPHDARSMSILGELYGIEGEGDDIALSLCTKAVNIDEFSWDNWYRLAKVCFLMADYDSSYTAVREALHRNRKAVEAIFLVGEINMVRGNKKQAKKRFNQVLRIDPGFQGASKALKEIG